MESIEKSCSLSNLTTKCSQEKHFKTVDMFTEKQLDLIRRRSGINFETVCLNHQKKYLIFYEQRQNYCCDPLKKHSNSLIKKSLWIINSEFDNKFHAVLPDIVEGKKLCRQCRKLIVDTYSAPELEIPQPQQEESTSDDSVQALSSQASQLSVESNVAATDSSQFSDFETPVNVLIEQINKSLKHVNIQSIQLKHMQNEKYRIDKLNEIISFFKINFNKIAGINNNAKDAVANDMQNILAAKEMISQLKEKFEESVTINEKIMVLSVLPPSWSVSKIQEEFEASNYLIRKTKQLVKEEGILCTSKPKSKNLLPQETIDCVIEFYEDQEISRELPGKKDFVSVQVAGNRVHVQKRLILGNLKEIFYHFKKTFSQVKVSFSKFAQLRPKHCILAGAAGTHTVCVCSIHQNFKLLIDGASLRGLEFNNATLATYKDFLKIIQCRPPTENCHFRKCSLCSSVEELRSAIINMFEENDVENVTYQQWIQVDRCSLETVTKSTDDFVEDLIQKLETLSLHNYISKKQSEFFRLMKENLEHGEVLIVADFSENYSFIIQDSVQAVYYNNKQATIHPFACYYRSSESNMVEPLNFIVISDELTHNTIAVHYFQHLLVQFLKEKFEVLTKLIYFSDGSPAQYKNRFNILNVCLHEKDFSVPAEWHYFATAHGKGPSDGLGGTIKRLVARASLQLPSDKQIQTPQQMFNWSKQNIAGITVNFASKEEMDKHKSKMEKRFKSAIYVQGIRSYHACVPQEGGFAHLKPHSFSEDKVLINVLENYKESVENETTLTRSRKRRKCTEQ